MWGARPTRCFPGGGEQVGEEVVGEKADVAFDALVEKQAGGDGGLVLPSSPAPPPALVQNSVGGHGGWCLFFGSGEQLGSTKGARWSLPRPR